MLNKYEESISQAFNDFKTLKSPFSGNYLAVVLRSILEEAQQDNIEKYELQNFIDNAKKKEGRKTIIKLLFTKGVPDSVFEQISIDINQHTNKAYDFWVSLCKLVHFKKHDNSEEFCNEVENIFGELVEYWNYVWEAIHNHLESQALVIDLIEAEIDGKFNISGHDIYEDYQLVQVNLQEFSWKGVKISVEGTISKDLKYVGIEHFPCNFNIIQSKDGSKLIVDESSIYVNESSFYGV